jgi:hypothetical protein
MKQILLSFLALWFIVILLLIALQRSHDVTRQIIVDIHECYQQEQRAVLINGEVECRPYD